MKISSSLKQVTASGFLLLVASLCGCGNQHSKGDAAEEQTKAKAPALMNLDQPPLRKPGYTYAYWQNGWRKNKSDTNQAILAIQTSGYDFSLNPADFSSCGFALGINPNTGYAEALHSGVGRLQQLPSAQIIIELEENGKTYRAVNCQAGIGTDVSRLSSARLWESGRFVQHFDFLGLKFADAEGHSLNCGGTLDLVAWPDSLTISASVTPDSSLAWTGAKIRVRLKGNGLDCLMEKLIEEKWTGGVEKTATLTYHTPQSSSLDTNISLQVSAGGDQTFPVTFEAKKNCLVASVSKIKRNFQGGYTDIRDYDEFAIVVENRGSLANEVPFLLDFWGHANITGLCPMLCDETGRPTGIPVQLSKNWHNGKIKGEYLMAYTSLPAKPGKNEYRLRIAYGFYGTLPSASHSQLCLIAYGGNGRWDQLAIGCWGETFCLDMDMSLVNVAITDVRMLMARNGLNGTKWNWTDAGWGGDWLGMWNASDEKLAFNDLKTAYLSQGPCLTDVRYDGSYGASHEVSLAAQVQTLRTDDHARTFQNLKYTFNTGVKTDKLWFYKMGSTPSYITPQIAYGNKKGVIAESNVPANLKPHDLFVDQATLTGDGPWWVAFPGARPNEGSDRGTGYRALVIRSYQATFGGKTFTQPTISLPVDGVQKDGSGLDLDLLLVAPKSVTALQPGDSVEMNLEWITLPRIADDYYGPNETFRKHLAENPSSWKTTYREAIGNDLVVSVKGGTVLSRYPIVIQTDRPIVTVSLKGGVGFVPIRFENLKSVKNLALFQVVSGKEVKLDQSVHGNDFWQTDYDEGSQTYKLTYNLPLDGQPESNWILKSERE